MCKSVWEMNSILKLTHNLPYIGGGDANNFREMRRLIRESLEATCTVHEA